MDNLTMNPSCLEKKKYLFPILAVLFIIISFYFLFRTITEVKSWKNIDNTQNVISFTETGEVFAKPDLAVINFAVVTEKPTVNQATAENTSKTNSVIEKIKAEGVDPKDLKTTSYAIYPIYAYEKALSSIYPYPPSGERNISGYNVTQNLEVKIRDLAKIGKIIETATGAGANEIGQFQLIIDKQDDLKKQAREQAIGKARQKAKDLASQLGVKLDKIVSFNDNSYSPYYYGIEAKGMGGVSDANVPAPQIETGENKISVTVTITYQIN